MFRSALSMVDDHRKPSSCLAALDRNSPAMPLRRRLQRSACSYCSSLRPKGPSLDTLDCDMWFCKGPCPSQPHGEFLYWRRLAVLGVTLTRKILVGWMVGRSCTSYPQLRCNGLPSSIPVVLDHVIPLNRTVSPDISVPFGLHIAAQPQAIYLAPAPVVEHSSFRCRNHQA